MFFCNPKDTKFGGNWGRCWGYGYGCCGMVEHLGFAVQLDSDVDLARQLSLDVGSAKHLGFSRVDCYWVLFCFIWMDSLTKDKNMKIKDKLLLVKNTGQQFTNADR